MLLRGDIYRGDDQVSPVVAREVELCSLVRLEHRVPVPRRLHHFCRRGRDLQCRHSHRPVLHSSGHLLHSSGSSGAGTMGEITHRLVLCQSGVILVASQVILPEIVLAPELRVHSLERQHSQVPVLM